MGWLTASHELVQREYFQFTQKIIIEVCIFLCCSDFVALKCSVRNRQWLNAKKNDTNVVVFTFVLQDKN